MWLFNKNRVEQVAESISQLIHTLAAGRAEHGPTGPERFLRSVAPLLSEDTIIGQRVVKLLVAMTGKAKFFVSLATAPDHFGQRLTIDGRGEYSGFSLACMLPPRTVMIDLHPSAVGHRADLLYAACKAMPNVVERRHFR
jgi:hypothetical protein